MAENFIPMYDLESLNEAQRQDYVKAICKHLGVPDNLNLIALTYVDDAEGPSRLVAYAKRGATENVRNGLQINIESLTHQMIGGSIVFTAVAKSDKTGRREIATGSKWIEGLQGTQLDDAIMTAQTRALRRVTLQFIGAGVLDESEVNQRKVVHVTSVPAVFPPQSTVSPASGPGKDVTPHIDPLPSPEIFVEAIKATIEDTAKLKAEISTWKSQEEFEAHQAKLRADAIAQLNKTATPEPSSEPLKKTRKPRGPNKKKVVDLGPSEPPVKTDIKPDIAAPIAAPTPAPAPVVEQPKADIKPDIAPPVRVAPKLSPDTVKPFRQRLFRVVNDYLEPNGFAPKEGMGNADKMRAFATLMFPEVTNMNQLDEVQWEKYLSILENKIKTEGPAATVKYIEESIGI